ncbi:SurA N-terminal domain-containing protein [Mangrovicoccus sp. HB161399]|uniref:SurA N-terminal domain-containing protein n=1 Tax=Mangrovicoccus sp. HB161399 TaxID=2720392 RepID=UPI001551A374|nr:SurA N-terminal domain-containing protein [Mangrovicoccus sp. HB161399]
MLKKLLQGAGAALVLSLAALAQPAGAQSPFDPVVRVNESVITRFEVEQRMQFLTVLRQSGLTRDGVIDALIDERLELAEAARLDVTLSEDQLQQAMEEFASRANLSADEFVAAIAQQGVDPETFRDFVRAGTAWRDVVRSRYASQARVSDEEIDRAIALGTGQGSVQVQLAEIVLPLLPETAGLVREQADAIQQMKGFDEFSRAARDLSASPSGDSGGALGWMPLSNLPEQIAPLMLSMAPGDVTPPLPLPNVDAIALFQLRGLRDSRPGVMQNVTLDYMLLRTPQGAAPAEMARLEPLVSTCDSIYSHVSDPGGTRIEHVTGPRAETAAGVRGVIDRLDPLEMAVLPGNSAVVMLCARTPIAGADLSRDDLQRRLFSRKLEDLANGYLAELRANAFIERL